MRREREQEWPRLGARWGLGKGLVKGEGGSAAPRPGVIGAVAVLDAESVVLIRGEGRSHSWFSLSKALKPACSKSRS